MRNKHTALKTTIALVIYGVGCMTLGVMTFLIAFKMGVI